MGLIFAGFRGGIAEDTGAGNTVALARSILTGKAGKNEVLNHLESIPWPRTLSVVVNNACNLKCRHCYLQVDRLTEAALTIEDWERFFTSVASTGVHLVTLAGKEVFLGTLGREVLGLLTRIRQNSRKPVFRLGLVSNGTLLSPWRDLLLSSDLSYFDISVDGLPADHDAIRGSGAFDLALPNIRWAASECPDSFHVACTLQRRNASTLPQMVRFFDGLGLRRFGLGFYHALPYTDASLRLDRADLESIFDCLLDLEKLSVDHLDSINLDVGMIEPELFDTFLSSCWFDLELIRADKSGEVFISHTLANGLRLNFRFAPFPTGVYLSSRITPEGNYLASEDTVNSKLYAERRLCTVRDHEHDFRRMHAIARSSGHLRNLFNDYWTKTAPHFLVPTDESFLSATNEINQSVLVS